MSSDTEILLTGFVRSADVLERSLAPLRALRRDGVVRRILYVTWDDPALDAWLAPLETCRDVELVRIAQPAFSGTGGQRGVLYQIHNLEEGLSRIANDSTVVLKLRPDMIIAPEFLRRKIAGFDQDCAPAGSAFEPGLRMPAARFGNKIWIPWADANQPFFFEDAAFMGRKRDVMHMLTQLTAEDIAILGVPDCNLFAHVVRYGRIFVEPYPLFANYLGRYRYFVKNLDYRRRVVPHMLQNGFFWHLLIANAWILHTQFHVDAGEPGDITFFANAVNPGADWAQPESLVNAAPYDRVREWRERTEPGSAFRCVDHPFGRLMDDRWQRALFTSELKDFSRGTLRRLLENIAACGDGRLNELEDEFYRKLAHLHRIYWVERFPSAIRDAS